MKSQKLFKTIFILLLLIFLSVLHSFLTFLPVQVIAPGVDFNF